MSVTVTASNGWVHKPIQEEDASAFMKCFKDYPFSPGTTPITYEERLTKFSQSLLTNEVGTLPLTSDAPDGVNRVYGTYKPDGTLVGARTYCFYEPTVMVILNGVIHPDHRGNKYQSAQLFLGLALAKHYNITSFVSALEATPTFSTMNHLKTKYTDKGINCDAGDKTSTDQMLDGTGQSVALKSVTATLAQADALLAANSTWASITYTIS